MLFNQLDLIAKKEENETVYEFCEQVIRTFGSKNYGIISCDIDGIYFCCYAIDNVESLINKYTEAHKKAIGEAEAPEAEETKATFVTKVKMFWTIDADGLERSINEFISDKELVDIKYSSVLVNLPNGGTAISDRAMVIYKED